MMVERSLEAALVAAIEALGVEGLRAVGSLQPSRSGDVAGMETPDAAALCAVSAGLRSYDSFTVPAANVPLGIALTVRTDRDATRACLEAFAAPLLSLFTAWQLSISAVKAVFDVPGFAPFGLRFDGGETTFDRDNAVWTLAATVTLRGRIDPVDEISP